MLKDLKDSDKKINVHVFDGGLSDELRSVSEDLGGSYGVVEYGESFLKELVKDLHDKHYHDEDLKDITDEVDLVVIDEAARALEKDSYSDKLLKEIFLNDKYTGKHLLLIGYSTDLIKDFVEQANCLIELKR